MSKQIRDAHTRMAGSADDSGAAAAGAFAKALRTRLDVPALLSFTVPTDLLTSQRDKYVSTQLGLQPGLYDGIAVVTARCEPGGQARSAPGGARPARALRHDKPPPARG